MVCAAFGAQHTTAFLCWHVCIPFGLQHESLLAGLYSFWCALCNIMMLLVCRFAFLMVCNHSIMVCSPSGLQTFVIYFIFGWANFCLYFGENILGAIKLTFSFILIQNVNFVTDLLFFVNCEGQTYVLHFLCYFRLTFLGLFIFWCFFFNFSITIGN